MEEAIEFSFVEYISIFISIICGYIASEFLSGWGRFFRHRSEVKIDVPYVLLTVLVFIFFIDFWWSTWGNYRAITSDIFYFFLFLAIPFCFYFFSVILFPSEQKIVDFDSKLHYQKNNSAIWLTFIVLMLFSAIIAAVMIHQPILHNENVFRIAAILASILLIVFRRKRIFFLVVIGIAYVLIFVNIIINR